MLRTFSILHHHFTYVFEVVLFLFYLVRHNLIEVLLGDWLALRVFFDYLSRV
jgi:hypothetical protein